MAKNLHIGDLVVSRDQVRGDQIQSAEPGIVVELRRADCKVFLPESRKTFWVHHENLLLVRVVAGERTLPAKISRLLRRLDALECELYPMSDGVYRLDICHERLDLPLVDEIREFLSQDLVSFTIEPRSMGAIKTVIQFR